MGREVGSGPDQAFPARLGRFVGRTTERAILREQIAAGTSLLTVTGLAGVGKSRLVREAFGDLIDGWISASDIQDSASLLPAAEQRAEALLIRAMPDRQLIVLDSIDDEQVGRELVSALDRFTGLQIIITSRTRMNVAGEVLLRLEPLRYPRSPTDVDLANPTEWEALECFIQSTKRVRIGFELNAQNLPAVVELLHSTGGLPLAIDLLANWLRVSNVNDLARRVRGSLEPFTGGPADLPLRHRDLQASIRSSIDELQAEDREVLITLAHLGAVSAEGLGHGLAREVPLASLGRLVDRNLVKPFEPQTNGIFLHPMVRRGAADQSDAADARRRFLEWLSDELAKTVPLLVTKHSRTAAARMDRLAADIAAGLDLLTVEPWMVATMITHLCDYWSHSYQVRSQLRWTTEALEIVDDNEPLEARLHLGASRAYELLLDLENAEAHCARALPMARRAEDHTAVVLVLTEKLACGVTSGSRLALDEEYQEAVELCRRHRLNDALGNIFSIRAERMIYLGSPAAALELATQGIEAANASENLMRQTWCWLVQSWAFTNLGDFEAAAQSQRNALLAAQQIDNRCALDLAVYMYEGDTFAAAGCLREGVDRLRRVVNGLETIEVPLGMTETTRMLAELLAELGDHPEARRQFKRSIELAVALDNVMGIWSGLVAVALSSPAIRPALPICGEILRMAATSMPEVLGSQTHRARERLMAVEAEIAVISERTSGVQPTLTVEEYVTLVVRHLGASEPAPRPHRLSLRELEVLRRLAVGETDAEIAGALVIGIRTVNSHVSAILRKLGVQRRRQAAAWARVNLDLSGQVEHAV